MTNATDSHKFIDKQSLALLINRVATIHGKCHLDMLINMMPCRCQQCRVHVAVLMDQFEDLGIMHTEAIGGYVVLHTLPN